MNLVFISMLCSSEDRSCRYLSLPVEGKAEEKKVSLPPVTVYDCFPLNMLRALRLNVIGFSLALITSGKFLLLELHNKAEGVERPGPGTSHGGAIWGKQCFLYQDLKALC